MPVCGETGVRIWLAVVSLALCLLSAPFPGMAVQTFDTDGYRPFTLAAAQTPLEAQMLGESPFQSHSAPKDAAALFSNLGSEPAIGRGWGGRHHTSS